MVPIFKLFLRNQKIHGLSQAKLLFNPPLPGRNICAATRCNLGETVYAQFVTWQAEGVVDSRLVRNFDAYLAGASCLTGLNHVTLEVGKTSKITISKDDCIILYLLWYSIYDQLRNWKCGLPWFDHMRRHDVEKSHGQMLENSMMRRRRASTPCRCWKLCGYRVD